MGSKPSLSEIKAQIREARALASKEWPMRQAQFYEALRAFFIGRDDEGKLCLRDVINASMGFEQLANATGLHSKSIHRMLSKKGNPTSRNLFLLIRTIALKEGFDVRVSVGDVRTTRGEVPNPR
jgi:DNA-binding phage protein